jgi:immune inhibitor A
MYRFLVLSTLLWILVSSPGSASTLDPSHPVWTTNPFAEQWARAVADLRGELAQPQKFHASAARGRIAAVGRRVLVIPVIPSDATGVPRTQDELATLWSGNAESTVEGYWRYVSGGALDLEVRVLPWLDVPGTLQSDYPNVINGAPAANLTAGPRNLAKDALAAAARLVEDLHVFDDDGPDGIPGSGDDDGILDMVVVLHPFEGWESDPVEVSRGIVSLQARLGRAPIAGTELLADAFVVASARGPLGVWVHELGHLLGLSDLYDSDRSPVAGTAGGPGPQGGLGRWSLMASGTWGGGGSTPSGLDPWSRWSLGFGEFEDRDAAERIGLPWVDGELARAVRIHPLGEWGEEFFFAEARKPRPGSIVDGDLPGGGALVYRVRPDLEGNTIDAKFLELLQADGRDDLGQGVNDGDGTDPWDGSPGRARLDGSTTPSSESAFPSPMRTAPALEFDRFSAGMEVVLALASGQALQLDAFGVRDAFFGTRTWLRPAESAALLVRLGDAGEVSPSNATLDIEIDPAPGRALSFTPPGPWSLVKEDGDWVLGEQVRIADSGDPGVEGEAGLTLILSPEGGGVRTVRLGLPVTFSDGLPPDALARFVAEAFTDGADTTRFERLPLAALPSSAFVGYELVTDGVPGYANSVDTRLNGPWFAIPPDARAELWTRGSTEEGIPGQVFDGAALEIFLPERGWQPLEPTGRRPVWISRRSLATTRDRIGFGGDEPQWESYAAALPRAEVPVRLRIRFASDGSISGGTWRVAGLQTDAYPRAEVSLSTRRDGAILATAELSGDFSRITLGAYRYRVSSSAAWAPASGVFNVGGGDVFSVELDLLPASVQRAEIALFSGFGEGNHRLGTAGLRRDPAGRRLPRLVTNPAQGIIVLQSDVSSQSLPLSVYDLRGRLRARLTIPPETAWFEWEPRSDGGDWLSSGSYFLRADGMDSTLRFTWFR